MPPGEPVCRLTEQAALTQGLRELPVTLKQGNVTFANLPSTFAALTRLVEASKPTSKPLTTLFSRLRPLVTTATPAVGNFNLAINRAGPNNDLTDIARALPGLARALSTSSPATVQSLKESVPLLAAGTYPRDQVARPPMPGGTTPGVAFRADADSNAFFLTYDIYGYNLRDSSGRAPALGRTAPSSHPPCV